MNTNDDKKKKLKSKIRYFEDMLLRSNDKYEIERLQIELYKMRKTLQRMEWSSKN